MIKNQNFPPDGSVLTTKNKTKVYHSRGGFTINPIQEYGGPVVADKKYGHINNRATKRYAEKELNQNLFWREQA